MHRLRVRIDSAFPDQPARRLGFALAVVPQQPGPTFQRTGELASDDSRAGHPIFPEADLTHVAPITYTAPGYVEIDVELRPQQAGDHLLYIVVNESDGDGQPSAGNYVWPQRFCFVVGETGGAAGDECDAVLGSAPLDDSDTDIDGGGDDDDESDPDSEREGCGCQSAGGPMDGSLAVIGLILGWRRGRRRGGTVRGSTKTAEDRRSRDRGRSGSSGGPERAGSTET